MKIRTQKKSGNTVLTQYYLSGETVVAQKTDGKLLTYLFDENGDGYGFIYDGTQYYYCKNLQGDVKYIYDLNGNIKAWYRYDAWGNCTVHNVGSSTLGDINPIRYRGYMYDTETGLYYLQSRYYDPVTGRFISPDAVDYLGANETVDSYNLYAYCENDPVSNSDNSGNFSIPRLIISVAVDSVIWGFLSPAATSWAAVTQPIKAMARTWGKELLKTKVKAALTGFMKTLVQVVEKVSATLVPVIKKAVGWLFSKWASKLTAKTLSSTILGAIGSSFTNGLLNAIASNVTMIFSVGGLVAGLWDYYSDSKMNGWIKLW